MCDYMIASLKSPGYSVKGLSPNKDTLQFEPCTSHTGWARLLVQAWTTTPTLPPLTSSRMVLNQSTTQLEKNTYSTPSDRLYIKSR